MNNIASTNQRDLLKLYGDIHIVEASNIEKRLNEHIAAITDMEKYYSSHVKLNPHDICLTHWVTIDMVKKYNDEIETKKKIMFMTNNLVNQEISDHSEKFLNYLELYSSGIAITIAAKMQNNMIGTALRSIHHIKYTSLHIMDSAGHSIDALKYVIDYIKSSTGSDINLITLSHTQFPFIDGRDSLTTANIRSWKNKMSINGGKINLFICEGETAQGMILALISLCKDGAAYIKFSSPDEKNISTLHLFIQYFQCVRLIHTDTTNKIYIYAEGYLGGFRMRDDIYKFCDERKSTTLFNESYLSGDEYKETSKCVMAAFELMWSMMINHYNNIMDDVRKINKK